LFNLLKKYKIEKTFEMRAEIFLTGMKAQREEGGGRILLGDNTGGVWSYCGRSGYNGLVFSWTPLCVYICI
jgi:hypothetical protein